MIVGVVIAIVGVISIVGLIFLFVRRKHNKEKQRLADAAVEKMESANSYRPFISRPFGGELGSSDLHEMEPSNRPEMDSLTPKWRTERSRPEAKDSSRFSRIIIDRFPLSASRCPGARRAP